MERGGAVRFDRSSLYSRAQIHGALGGGRRASLPTRGGAVVCACMRRRKNPRAPDEMLIGRSESALRLARAFAASGRAVPVFVSVRPGGWEYMGERRVRSLMEDPGAILALIAEGAPPDTTLVLLLEEDPRTSLAAADQSQASPGS